jgi:hypothetical protein
MLFLISLTFIINLIIINIYILFKYKYSAIIYIYKYIIEIFINLIGGCMHMVCTRARCGYHWCWVCQTEWTRECMSNHWFT